MEGFTATFIPILLLLYSLFIRKLTCIPLDAITATQPMKDGDTLVSAGGSFEMGFFSPGNSGNRFVGIWYKNISPRTVVWVANRDAPLTNTSVPAPAQLKLMDPGILILLNGTNHAVWSSGSDALISLNGNPVAKLSNPGNLIVTGDNAGYPLWQSFDYLTDTFLPGMKLGKDLVTGKECFLSSWKSDDNPAPGNYTWRVDTQGYPDNILREGPMVRFRAGLWNGRGFRGGASLSSNPELMFTYNMYITYNSFDEKEMVYTYTLRNTSVLSRFELTSYGVMERWIWEEAGKNWLMFSKLPRDDCDSYSVCGPYGSCNISNSPKCGCLDSTRFVPKRERDWRNGDWPGGCERRKPLDCANGATDVFLKYSQIKLPDTRSATAYMRMDLKECGEVCLKNCSCMAYATLDIRNGGSGCLFWFDDLIDIRAYPDGVSDQDIYVRMAHSELDTQSNSGRKKGANLRVILPVTFLGMVVTVLSITLFLHAFCMVFLRVCWIADKKLQSNGYQGLPVKDLTSLRMKLSVYRNFSTEIWSSF